MPALEMNPFILIIGLMMGAWHLVSKPTHRANLPFSIRYHCTLWRSATDVLGQPETMPRLDNVHRFLAGI
jgi:hypothetical protein